jgi:hypothetical protein
MFLDPCHSVGTSTIHPIGQRIQPLFRLFLAELNLPFQGFHENGSKENSEGKENKKKMRKYKSF